MPEKEPDRFRKARRIFRNRGGILRTSEAIRAGVHPRTLYQMRDSGKLERLGRGLYRLADLPPLGDPDLVSVALRIPKGVICLISALAYHDLTSQVPHEIYLALQRGMERPRLEHPPVRTFWFAPEAFRAGVESHEVDGVQVRVYCPEKTVADCFKFRNRIGLDVALEALQRYLQRGGISVDRLLRYGRLCRVENVMRPYLEAMI
jgi:predicted transcriptional regulator of viral defense system